MPKDPRSLQEIYDQETSGRIPPSHGNPPPGAPSTSRDELLSRFASHDLDDDQTARIGTIRSVFTDLAGLLDLMLVDGREKSLAFTHLETAGFFAIAAVSREKKAT